MGFIRQDSLAKKVYYITLGVPYENLLYDFNLQVGDFYTETYNHNSQDTFIISKVDSILLNGSYRKKYTLLPPVVSGGYFGSDRRNRINERIVPLDVQRLRI